MKKLLAAMLLAATIATAAQAAAPKVVGKGEAMRLDPSSFPPGMKANYEIFKAKCVRCHSQERIIVAIQTGIAPISGQPFDSSAARAYGARMLKKSDCSMTKADVRATVELIDFLLVNNTER